MTQDPEISAMSQISEALSDLDSQTAERVLRWAVDKFSQGKINISKLLPESQGQKQNQDDFTDLSDLFVAANPKNQKEKVLVAGYWFQEFENYENIDAQTVNNALKNLGHGISNITRAFGYLQDESPKLAIQVQKKGSAKQARKDYKITREGKKKVKDLISGNRG